MPDSGTFLTVSQYQIYLVTNNISSESEAGEGQIIPEFVLKSKTSQDRPHGSSVGYGAWYLKPKTWNNFYESKSKKKKQNSDSKLSKLNKQTKGTPQNATAKAFDQFIRDNKMYTKSKTIKEILN